MIMTSTDEIKGKRIIEVLGLVKGNTVRARHIGQDILATLKNIIGGEVHNYTKLIAESREQAIDLVEREIALERRRIVEVDDLGHGAESGAAAGETPRPVLAVIERRHIY